MSYVSPKYHSYVDDIEVREKAGTPGAIQVRWNTVGALVVEPQRSCKFFLA